MDAITAKAMKDMTQTAWQGSLPGRLSVRAARPHTAVFLLALVYLVVRAFWSISSRRWVLESAGVESLLKLALWGAPCVVALAVARRQTIGAAFAELGLGGRPGPGIRFGFFVTIPMLAAMLVTPLGYVDLDLILDSVLVGPLTEEVLFRGFLCWQLVRRAGWPVGWAIAVSALFFGLAHLRDIDLWLKTIVDGPSALSAQVGGYAGHWRVFPPLEVWWILVSNRLADLWLLAPYAAGGALFAWISLRWQSLWPAVSLHAFLNLWWVLAKGEGPRLVSEISPMSIAHALAVAIAIVMTLRHTQKSRAA